MRFLRKLKHLKRLLRRRSTLLIALFLLLLLSLSYFFVIRSLEQKLQRQVDVDAKIDMLQDPQKFLQQSRREAFKEVEPLITLLYYMVPTSFALVGFVCLWKALTSGPAWQPTRTLNEDQQRRMEALSGKRKLP